MKFCLLGLLSCVFLASCGGYDNSCAITAAVTPATATADHTASVPGNQAQFSVSSSVRGNCPLVADKIGTWSTSDPDNTTNGLGFLQYAELGAIPHSSYQANH